MSFEGQYPPFTVDPVTKGILVTLAGSPIVGSDIKTGTSPGNTVNFEAYDTDNAVYRTFAVLTAGVTPSFNITAPAGGTITITGATVTGLPTPTAASDAATKAYVDSFASGLTPFAACVVATTAALTATYLNGAAGVGATLTNSGVQTALVIDGVTLSVTDRVLVKDYLTPLDPQNGIYTVTNVGSGATNWVLTRATDFDTGAEVVRGAYTTITLGTLNQGHVYIETGAGPFVIGTTPIIFSSFGVFGRMAQQNADNVNITGGIVNSTVIGGVTPAAGSFTTVNALTLTPQAVGFTAAGGITSKTLTVLDNTSVNQDVMTTSQPYFDKVGINIAPSLILDVQDAQLNPTAAGITGYANVDQFRALVTLRGSRGTTIGTSVETIDLDKLGVYLFEGVDSLNNFQPAAGIGCIQDGASGSNWVTGKLLFAVTQDTFAGPQIVSTLDKTGRFETIGQLASTIITGTAPFDVVSTTLVTNLNADLLDGQHGSFYQNAGNINAGVLGANFGGTGIANNAASTLTISGSFATTLTITGITTLTLPTSGTVFSTGNTAPNEVPTGVINGINVTYTLANTPIGNSLKLYLNGSRQAPGGGADYTIAGNTITFNAAPTGTTLLADYNY